VENGKIKGIRQGEANITVSFAGNENYTAAENKTIAVTVNLNDASVTVNNETLNLEVGQNFTIVANTVPEGVNVTYVQDDSGVYIVDENGVVTALAEGTAIITVEVGDGEIYAINSTNITVNVKKINTAMDISAGEITEGENATITITLPGDATGNVNTTVNGKTYSSEVKDGKAVITIPDLLKGDYTLPITYSGDDKYNPLTKDLNITVEGGKAIISAPELVKYYSGPERFTVNLTYARGSPAANKPVNITLNGVTYPRTTDENGIASLNINLGAGEYPVSVVVDDVLVNSTVTVKSTIDASDVVKMFRNDTQYYARFSDANGTALANTNVSFNINGVIYNRTTDGNGTAKLNINLGAGDYILTAINPITGEMESNTIKVISQIESSDLTKYYKNASQFVVHIHSDDGSYVGAGEEVTFNINGVFYTRTTNATGHAKLNINLPQGNYTITTQYKNCTQSNEIAVLPVLNADNLVMKYRDGSQFKAKLVDGQGKAYAGQSVQFNINGVLYNRETGSDGIAKLNINLMSGEYIITSSYNGFNIANKITIKS
ncbi:MAG: Ig-like domain repeat protein, partial [Methanobrevibacter sp.]|nr:Ig-like domain repeat protein [Methanobrevibacter sp.]